MCLATVRLVKQAAPERVVDALSLKASLFLNHLSDATGGTFSKPPPPTG
jgi:hypothetical protein